MVAAAWAAEAGWEVAVVKAAVMVAVVARRAAWEGLEAAMVRPAGPSANGAPCRAALGCATRRTCQTTLRAWCYPHTRQLSTPTPYLARMAPSATRPARRATSH